ncbi:MAG: response regulator transcription factor [Bacteroidales bacterium]|nr:response regulator transcription factor [Bacteroidales bacterium]
MQITITQGIEFFKLNGELNIIRDSKVHPWNEIKSSELEMLRRDLDRFPEKEAALERAGIHGVDQLYHFANCYHGDLNNEPDFINGRNNRQDYEYCQCDARGTGKCNFSEVLCGKGSYHAPFGNLSPREVEVAQKVADGLTDDEIAERLFISRNTVKTHISHIGDKIGRNTRSFIASFAIRHNLC